MPRTNPIADVDPVELLAMAETMTAEQIAEHYNCHYQTVHKRLRAIRAERDPIMAYTAPRGWKRGSCHPGLPCWGTCLDNVDAPCAFAAQS